MSIPKDLANGLVVKKGGLFLYSWDGGQKITSTNSITAWLNKPLYIDDGVTFEDFFKWVMKDHEIASVIFQSDLGGYDLGDWIDEWRLEDPMKDDEDDDQEIDYLAVYWGVERNKFNSRNRSELDEAPGFHGVGRTRSPDAYGDNDWHDTNFSFSFTPLNEMKHYLFKLNDEYNIIDGDIKAKNVMKDDDWYLFKSYKSFTVYDVISAILDDISFYGAPAERQETADDLLERSQTAINEFESFDSFEDFKEKLKDEEESETSGSNRGLLDLFDKLNKENDEDDDDVPEV